jgi:hypothetical protein
MVIDISEKERECLFELLEREIRDLRQELHRTDSFEYKERLEQRDLVLTGILQKFSGSTEQPDQQMMDYSERMHGDEVLKRDQG